MFKHYVIPLIGMAILVGVISVSLASADSSATINFEGMAEGSIVTELSCGSGITCSGGDLSGPVLVRAHNPAIDDGNTNVAMIFNSDCVAFADCTGQDDDLSFPGHGNTLISSEDLDQTDPDDTDVAGVFMEFDFSGFGPEGVTVHSIDVGDIDEREFGAFVEGSGGPCIGVETGSDDIPIPLTGNNGIETVSFELSGVHCLLVHLNGSGAVDNIEFTTVDQSEPAIDLEKATNGEDADSTTGPVVAVGSTVEFSYQVTNTGDVDLSNVTVLDDQGVAVSCAQDTLAVGESMTCTGSTTATAGQYTNLGTACGDGAGQNVCDEDPSNHFGASPAIDLEKSTNGEDADSATGPVVPVGSTVEFTYEVTNTGNVDLSNVTVVDDQGVAVSCAQDTLGVGESMTCSGSTTATPGQYTNLGTACGDGAGQNVCDEDPSNHFGGTPAIDLEKATNGEDADEATGPVVAVGSTVEFSYQVTNTGDVDLSNVTVLDDQGVAVSCAQGSLAAGESMTCSGSTTATPGQYTNLGTACGDGAGQNVCDEDPSNHFGGTPAIDLEKSTNGEDADEATGPVVAVGSTVEFTYEVTNTGGVDLSNVTVVDDQVSVPATGSAAATINFEGLDEGAIVTELSCGSGITCSGGDLGGSVLVRAHSPAIDDGNTNAAMIFNSDCAAFADCTGLDDDLSFPGHGNTLIISEDLDQTDPDDQIEPGSFMEFDFSGFGPGGVTVHRIDVGDIERREIGAFVEGSGGPCIGVETGLDDIPIPLTGNNGIETVSFELAGVHCLLVHLNGSGVVDNIEFTTAVPPAPAEVAVSCPQDTLAVGESMTCSGSTTATAGQYTNLGTACGDGAGQNVCDEDPSNHFGGTPAIDIEKATNGEDADEATGPVVTVGSTVEFSYQVTNTGDVDLSNVTVLDDQVTVPATGSASATIDFEGLEDDQGVAVSCPQDTLAVGESMTCSGSTTATAGQYTNLGTACGDGAGQNVCDEDPSNHFGGTPAIDLEKSTNGEDADEATGPVVAVGSTVEFSYQVTNTGDVDLSNVTVLDDQGVAVSCAQGSLAAGESMTCSGSTTATPGQYTNLGTACGDGAGQNVCDEDPSNHFGGTPAIDIEKATNGEDADEATGPVVAVGSTVEFSYQVTNTGDVDLSNVTVVDDQVTVPATGSASATIDFEGLEDDQGVAVSCPQDTLAVGESMTCSGSTTATAGQYTNLGTACGDGAGQNVCDEDPSNHFGGTPAIDIEKATNGEDADEATGPVVAVGSTVEFSYQVTNTGDVDLSNVTVVDDQGVAVSCAQGSLAAGESMTCSGSTTATAGQYTNLGTACGDGAGQNVCDEDPSNHFGGTPAIDIEKATNGEDADEATGPVVAVGSTVEFSYQVTNTGDVDLSNVTVLDDQGVAVSCAQGSLAAGESMTCSGSTTATAGQYTNLGTACGDGAGQNVCDEDPSNHFGGTPAIDIEKATNGEDADEATGPVVAVGSTVEFSYQVTNTGDVDLSNVTVVDDQGVAVSCAQGSLAAGESMTCSGSTTATAGQYTNLGTACGDGAGQNVCDEDPSNHFGGTPAIDIEKSTNGEDADEATGPVVAVGSTVEFSYQVTNTGDVDLSNVTVLDDQVTVPATGSASATIDFEGLEDDQGVAVSCPQDTLAVGESMTCSGSTTATPGQYTNLGTACGDGAGQNVCDEDPSNHFGGTPAIDLEKATNGEDADAATGPVVAVGSTVEFTYEVTNTGGVDLSNVTVVDDQVSVPATGSASATIDFAGLAEGSIVTELSCGSGITCSGGDLGGSVLVRAHSPAIDDGNTNAAMIFKSNCVAFADCTGEDDDLSFPGHGNTLIISEDLDQTDPDDQIEPGAFMEFDFSGFGPGGVTVHSIDVGDIEEREIGAFVASSDVPCTGVESGSDEIPLPITGNNGIETVSFELSGVHCLLVHLNGSGVVDNIEITTAVPPVPVEVVVSCPQDTLAVGESMTCTGSTTATPGQYTNLGTACGDGAGQNVCDEDPSNHFGGTPAIDLEKATNGEDADEATGPVVAVGSTVEFSYQVTNTGDVDLSNVTVVDDQGVAVSCAQGTLGVGESMTCSGSTTATAGQYTNLGTACGDGAGQNVCDEDPSNHFGGTPAIDIEKATNGEDADEATGPVVAVGSTVEFSYQVTNTGDVDLSNVTVVDDQGVAVSCAQSTLAAGESMTCSGSTTATAGQYTNLGTACGDGAGQNVCDEDPSNHFGGTPAIDLEKATNGEDADEATGPVVAVGSTVEFSYQVTNTGGVDLTNVTVVDDQVSVPATDSASATINFEGLDEGAIVTELSCGSGITCSGGDLGGPVLVRAHSPAIDDGDTNVAMIFDSDCAAFADCTGEDDDLSFPGHGNTMIISEDLDQTDPDDADLVGAFMEFDFSGFGPGGVTVHRIDVGDIDDREIGAFVEGSDGPCIGIETGSDDIPIPLTGNNEIETVSFELSGVHCLLVHLNGSGAVDNIEFTTAVPPVPVEVVVSCPQDTLAVGESMTCTGSTTATPGQYTNLGTACGDGAGQNVCDEDPSNHFGANSGVTIVNQTSGEDAEAGDVSQIALGEGNPLTFAVEYGGRATFNRADLVRLI